MNKTEKIQINAIIKDLNTGKMYRIINFSSKDLMTVVEMECTALNILYFNPLEIIKKINVEYELYIDETSKFVDINKLSEQTKESYLKKRNFINKVENDYGPNFIELMGKGKKPDFIEAYTLYNISKATAWRLIIRYLQQGKSNNALLSSRKEKHKYKYNKKPGRKPLVEKGIPLTDEVIKQFDEMLNDYKKNRNLTYSLIYDNLCYLYYSETKDGELIIKPASERPTYYQLYNYCTKKLTQQEKEIIKTSAHEFRNDKRLLTGSPMTTISGPGELLEMDAQEMDVAIVSELDRSKIIGRPILYALIDVYTKAIVAISVSFENNSLLGMTNCLLNLAEDKEKYCNQFGISNINQDLWPSNFLPKIIRMDRGSDFKSAKAEQMLNELNIQRELVPGASGSYKGYIEQLWHQLNVTQNASLYNHGLIEKRYDSTHYKKAVLTLKEITQIVISQVLVYNGLQLKNYPLTKDMVKNKIQPIPAELWKYGVTKNGNPRPIMNIKNFAYSLMSSPKASISRKGVCVDGLYYISSNKEFLELMYKAGTRSQKFECRYDERNISKLYYLNDKNELKELYLNVNLPTQKDFINCTKVERLDFLNQKSINLSEGEQRNQTLKSTRKAVIDSTVQNAKNLDTSTIKNKNDMRENRKKEQMLQRKTNNIETKLNISDETTKTIESKNETTSSTKETENLSSEKYEEFDPIMETMKAFMLMEQEEDKKYGINYEDE